jgi:hypothetical protein
MLLYEELYIINSTIVVLMEPLTPVTRLTSTHAYGKKGQESLLWRKMVNITSFDFT